MPGPGRRGGGMLRLNLVGNPAAKWFLAQEMRRLTSAGTFILLVGALYALWQHRFERSPGEPTLRLADLRPLARPAPGVEWQGPESDPRLRLRVDQAHSKVVARVDFPDLQPVDFLRVRFRLSATHLVRGREKWQAGRGVIEWHPPVRGPDWENNPFGSAKDNEASGVVELVLRPDHPPATPALRLENLGISGDLELSMFEATVLRERLAWKIGRWFLMAGWLAWAVAWIRPAGRTGMLRALLAAAVWMVMGLYFVVPGPWKDVRSMAGPFEIGPETAAFGNPAAPASAPPSPRLDFPPDDPGLMESVGKIPDQGDFALRLKHLVANARPLLHIALLFAPALAIACLVGRKRALSLTVILALAIEAAQVAFGYGFDWMDVFDLANDAVGIALGLWLYQRVKPRGWAARWLAPDA